MVGFRYVNVVDPDLRPFGKLHEGWDGNQHVAQRDNALDPAIRIDFLAREIAKANFLRFDASRAHSRADRERGTLPAREKLSGAWAPHEQEQPVLPNR